MGGWCGDEGTGGANVEFFGDDDQTPMAFTCGSFDQIVSYIQGIDGPKRIARRGEDG